MLLQLLLVLSTMTTGHKKAHKTGLNCRSFGLTSWKMSWKCSNLKSRRLFAINTLEWSQKLELLRHKPHVKQEVFVFRLCREFFFYANVSARRPDRNHQFQDSRADEAQNMLSSAQINTWCRLRRGWAGSSAGSCRCGPRLRPPCCCREAAWWSSQRIVGKFLSGYWLFPVRKNDEWWQSWRGRAA